MDLLIHTDHDDNGLSNIGRVPSWVPQWNNGANVSPLHIHDNSCKRLRLDDHTHRPESTNIVHGHQLRLRGVFIKVVQYASRRVANDQNYPSEQLLGLWREVKAENTQHLESFSNHLGFALLDAVSLGRPRGELAQWDAAKREFAQCLEVDNETAVALSRRSTQECRLNRHANRISLLAIDRLGNRRIIVLGQGFLGVTLAAARQGDLCALVDGVCSPLVLRPVPGRLNHYILVGNAYILRGTHVVDGVARTLRSDKDCKDWIGEYMPAKNIILV